MIRLLVSLFFIAVASIAAERPNILVIVADDLGYADVGFQGCKDIPTPHLDKLAAQSIRCTNGYVSHPFCSPTRAGLLTGRYQHRFGHENNPAWLPESTVAGLPLSQTTLPQLLKKSGYTTGAVGKWHLGAHPQFHPMKRGFEEYYGMLGGGHVYFPDEKGGPEYLIPMNRNGADEPLKEYITTALGKEAAAFTERHSGDGKPWFLYLTFNAPHTPLSAPKETIAKLAHIVNEDRRVYGAMILEMDAAIGHVITALDEKKQRENTLIFFVSDNGGPDISARTGKPCFTDNTPLRGHKGAVFEGGMRVPFLVSWPAKLKPGTFDHPVIAIDFLPTSVAVAGGQIPGDLSVDGVNLLPHLSGEKTTPPHETIFWRTSGPGQNYAARSGKWKFVRLPGTEPQLFDLSVDVGEKNNVAAANPEVLKKIEAEVDAWDKGNIAPIFESPKAGKPNAKKK
jgi:arylsulfatase A-like enzyme